jgi:chromosome partitioning protein
MAQPQNLTPLFQSIFEGPSLQLMLSAVDPYQFEDFVGYVFEQAGYFVEDVAGQRGPGLDLKLYIGPSDARRLHAGVQVKQFPPDHLVTAPDVVRLRGSVAANSVFGYFVTTSGYVGPALVQANGSPRIWPIDGDHFLRYITYVRGTRSAEVKDQEPDSRLHTNPLAPIPPEVLFAADELQRRPPQQTKILTVANHKGGVGKTTTALNLAFGLAVQDQQVLVVDMDAQANMTRVLPPRAANGAAYHIGHYFKRQQSLDALVRQTQFDRVWLIPSDNSLVQSDAGIAAGPGAEVRFVRDLHAAGIMPPPLLDTRPFDWIILDTGPSMGLFTRAAIAASHYVLMPIEPGVFTDLGANLLVDTVAAMGALMGAPISILGSLVTQWKQDALHEALLATATTNLDGAGIPLFNTRIFLDENNIEKAHLEAGQGERKTLFSHHKKSKAALGYAAAVGEVLSHVNQ